MSEAGSSRASPSDAGARLSLLRLRAARPAATMAFYEALGLDFAERRDGQGPAYWASVPNERQAFVLEIYPATCAVDTEAVRLGFEVASVADAVERLLDRGGTLTARPRPTAQGLRAVVADCDGRRVELVETLAR